jgi:hypothetical protein
MTWTCEGFGRWLDDVALLLVGTARAEAPASGWYRGLIGRTATALDTPERYAKNKEVEMELRILWNRAPRLRDQAPASNVALCSACRSALREAAPVFGVSCCFRGLSRTPR